MPFGQVKESAIEMAAISLSVIGKKNEPLYVREFDEVLSADLMSEELLFGLQWIEPSKEGMNGDSISARHQFVMHAALDRFEQLAGPLPGYGWRKPGASGVDGMFVGLLCPIEDLKVYGYVTTTRIKILLVVEDDAMPEMQSSIENDIRSLLSKIHQLFIEDHLINPFKDIGSKIVSKRFDLLVHQHISDFNQS
ncbi:MAG: hypothetical protein SGBAC_009463 [Bacillariaceae sp.]